MRNTRTQRDAEARNRALHAFAGMRRTGAFESKGWL